MPQQSDTHLTSVLEDLNKLSIRRQQLMDRRNILAMLIQFKRNNGQNEQQYSKENEEVQQIDEDLKVLSERKIQLEKVQEEGSHLIETTRSSSVVFVDSPPPFPAPQVILDVKQLPRHSSKTQCPFCRQFVTTEVMTKAGSVTYLVCFISMVFCCVAGCCLIPFFVDSCKDVIHKCPKCRSNINTCKKF
ncbi:uncharacterized protein LOC143722218 [Siphateles boraxobius]|uniref:uncharacterized protein LOC143722218 n=1 Tax=Siphateles boraxobius TaxID=180520 RepID=UPI0040636346